MLEKVKSSYIIKLFFLNIYERKKLKLIKYNKKFQKRLNITLFNYKHFTEKYIIFESNGTGKEYNISNNQLLFILS